jgi:hypothetical protein
MMGKITNYFSTLKWKIYKGKLFIIYDILRDKLEINHILDRIIELLLRIELCLNTPVEHHMGGMVMCRHCHRLIYACAKECNESEDKCWHCGNGFVTDNDGFSIHIEYPFWNYAGVIPKKES